MESIDQLDAVNISTAFSRIAKFFRLNRKYREQFLLDCNPEINKLKEKAYSIIRDFNPQEIANTVWAFATLGIYDEALFSELAQEAKSKLGSFNCQAISNTVWAFAKLDIYDKALFLELAKEAKSKLGRFNSQQIANTAWAFATLGIYDEAFFLKLAQEAKSKLGSFNCLAISNTVWAFAKLGIYDKALFLELAKEVKSKLGSLNPQHIATTAWAFAVVNYFDKDFSERIINKINDTFICLNDGLFNSTTLFQFHFVSLHWKYEHSNDRLSWSPALCKKMQQSLKEKPKPKSSLLHADVAKHIGELIKNGCKEEHYSEGYFIDIAYPEAKLAIEVNGPCHYAKNNNNILGSTQLKCRLLKKAGWQIISIPYWDWNSLKDKTAKTNYLQEILSGYAHMFT